jgi:anti-sigma regulatory factor (Ser/Thr protein kinase)
MIWSRLYPGIPESVSHARHFAKTRIRNPTHRDTVELIVSELATNAEKHTATGTPNGSFILHLIHHEHHVQIRVHDLGHPTNTPHIPSPDDEAEYGRGLALVATLAKQWGTEGDQTGHTTWADITVKERI